MLNVFRILSFFKEPKHKMHHFFPFNWFSTSDTTIKATNFEIESLLVANTAEPPMLPVTSCL